jgi:predicted Zn-dependent protease
MESGLQNHLGRLASYVALCLLLTAAATPTALAERYQHRSKNKKTGAVPHHVHGPVRVSAAHHAKFSGTQIVQYNGSQRTHGQVRAPYSHAINYTGAGGDYLSRMEGKSRWPNGHDIKVYVAPGRPAFPGIVASCFDQWSQATGGKITYTVVGSAHQADYIVRWTKHQHEAADGTEAGLTTTDTYVDDENQEYIVRARTNILTRYDGRSLSDKEIAETVLHEIGHGLGIEGHSQNPADIMYYAVSNRQSGHLTMRDANTMAHLYAY